MRSVEKLSSWFRSNLSTMKILLTLLPISVFECCSNKRAPECNIAQIYNDNHFTTEHLQYGCGIAVYIQCCNLTKINVDRCVQPQTVIYWQFKIKPEACWNFKKAESLTIVLYALHINEALKDSRSIQEKINCPPRDGATSDYHGRTAAT